MTLKFTEGIYKLENEYKIGGGNKLQPFIPSGNGEKSGENTKKISNYLQEDEKFIKNKEGYFNCYNSKLVKNVTTIYILNESASISMYGAPNTVVQKVKNGYLLTERYYNNKGEVYLDIDYTNHHNSKTHPCVPHIHKWYYDENNQLKRNKWEEFK
jgi:hypothetical protein